MTTATSLAEAATLLKARAFDLVFLEAGALPDAGPAPAQTLKAIRPDASVILLVPPARAMMPAVVQDENTDAAWIPGHTFIWSGTPEMLHALIRLVADRNCTDRSRRAVLLVEDSIEFASFFLPTVYREIDQIFPEGKSPRLILSSSHEDAMTSIRELGGRLTCVLSDTRLPKNGRESPKAGVDILSAAKAEHPGLPLILMSAECENRKAAERIPAPFLDKNDPGMDRTLHHFFMDLALVTPPFAKKKQDPTLYPVHTDVTGITKVGRGSMGGKAKGLALMTSLLHRRPELATAYPEMSVGIPRALVLCTDIFEDFVRSNSLKDMVGSPLVELVQAFIDAPLPRSAQAQIKNFLTTSTAPLAVRSSSLLEDAADHPCAGLYKTYMIPNNHEDTGLCMDHLATAVKLVYASAFYKTAGAFVHSTTARPFEDSMGVIIQEAAGRRYGDFFYPAVSGTAQSLNFYPAAGAKAEEGILKLAMGFGHTLAQEETGFRVSPKHPQSTPQFASTRDFLEKTQNQFYALRMTGYPDSLHFGLCANLERRDLAQAQEELPVKALSSTYLPAEDRIRDTWYCQGPKLLNFAQILKYDTPRLTALVNDLLLALAEETGGPVEMEFAASLPETGDSPWKISLLQARPMSRPRDMGLITQEDMDAAVCVSTSALGNCTLDTIRDIVYVNPNTFEGDKTPAMARQISRINADLAKANRRFLLAGPGRWGSSDPWLGIPVDWQQISGAGAIVEIRDGAIHADASWGSHFFNIITAQGIPYITVTPGATDRIDLDHLVHLPGSRTVRDEGFIRHLELNHPLVIKVDGKHSRCVILDTGQIQSPIQAA
ncbi:MAG: hypothetical protein MI863_09340 [Desulfobacterales bacterium]|nr:hypothetical protein [Desulfobacterales bacterium]